MRLLLVALVSLFCGSLHGQSDTQPPQLLGVSISPTTVDVSAFDRHVTITLQVTDDLSGIDLTSKFLVMVILTSPSGTQSLGTAAANQPGIVMSALIPLTLTIPAYSEPGFWTVKTLRLRDNVGNTILWNAAALTAAGFPSAMYVIDTNPDTQAPRLQAIGMTPSSVDVSVAPATVTVDLTLTDDRAGISASTASLKDFELRSPSGRQSRLISTFDRHLVQGTALNGVWRALFTMPQYSEPGVWSVVSVIVRDRIGTTRVYDAATMATFGASARMTVASSPADIVPPVLRSLSFTPGIVNTSVSSQAVRVDLSAADALSGVSFVPDSPIVSRYFGVILRSPSGAQFANTGFLDAPTSGTPLDGLWSLQTSLPQFSEEGTWKLLSITIKDVVGNLTAYATTAQITAAGFPTDLIVIRPSLQPDGSVDAAGGTVADATFGPRAELTIPPNVLSAATSIAIDVLQSPLGLPLPGGFSSAETYFVNVQLTPQPAYPLPAPGVSVTLPLRNYIIPSAQIDLYRIDPATGNLTPALTTGGTPVIGVVNADGLTATFAGVARFSTVVGLLPSAIPLTVSIRPDDPSNAINTKSHGKLPVVIFGTPTLDVTQLDPGTMRCSGAAVARTNKGKYLVSTIDLDGDGIDDLMAHFEIDGLVLTPSDTHAVVEGLTPDGRIFRGTDAVVIVK
jgi:hypothetical protein